MKRTSLVLISGLILGNSLFAGNGCPGYTPKKKPKQKSECSCKCEQMSHERGPRREITPNAGPCVSDGVDLFVTFDFIYWTAREEHVEFATTTGHVTANASSQTTSGHGAHPDWKFKPGFKIGAGLNFDHDGWDLLAQYTWYRNRDNKKTIRPGANTILQDSIIVVNGSFQNSNISSAQGKWSLNHFDVIDLELGRNFYISRYLMLRPFAGIKGSWQKQQFNATFNGIGTAPSGNMAPLTSTSYNELKYWGLGLRGGLDTSWHFTRTFSLFGNLAISTMWDFFKVSRIDNSQIAGTNTSLVNVKNDNHFILPVIESEVGLRYEEWFCDDRYHFSIEAGWEHQWWNGMNQFYQIIVGTRLGDLMVQGLTIHARFDF